MTNFAMRVISYGKCMQNKELLSGGLSEAIDVVAY
jgi:hypothetical protein